MTRLAAACGEKSAELSIVEDLVGDKLNVATDLQDLEDFAILFPSFSLSFSFLLFLSFFLSLACSICPYL